MQNYEYTYRIKLNCKTWYLNINILARRFLMYTQVKFKIINFCLFFESYFTNEHTNIYNLSIYFSMTEYEKETVIITQYSIIFHNIFKTEIVRCIFVIEWFDVGNFNYEIVIIGLPTHSYKYTISVFSISYM